MHRGGGKDTMHEDRSERLMTEIPSKLCPTCKYPPPLISCQLCDGQPRRLGPRFFLVDFTKALAIFTRSGGELLTGSAYLGKIKLAILLNLLLWCVFFLISLLMLLPWMQSLMAALPDWISWLAAGSGALLLTLFAGFFLFAIPMSLFLGPVLDPISRIAEEEALGWKLPDSGRSFVEETWDAVDTGARIFLMEILALLISFPLSFVVIGFPIAWFLASFLSGLAWLDYPMTRRGLGFGQKFRQARRHWALTCGLGTGFLLACLIPFFGLLMSGPCSAVAASLIYFEFEPLPEAPQR